MRPFAARRSEQGSSLVELLVATAIGLAMAALLAQTLIAYQTGYQRAATRVNGDQQAHRALALMVDEVSARHQAPVSATCPTMGVQGRDGRLEFSANLYDRSTTLREAAVIGLAEIVVEAPSAFEAGDWVMVVNVNDPADPGDDAADCLRIADIRADRWRLVQLLARSFPVGSPVALVNRVAYALDRRGRLMRTQDGGTQRIAQDVRAFAVEINGAVLVLRLTMHEAGEWAQRVAVEAAGEER